jgi:hypothetical protein
MKKFFKTVVIVGLCGVGVVALAHVVLGKKRAHDAAHALQNLAQAEVDELIAQQQDLKKELAKLREEYPKQIALVRSQINEIERDLEKLDKEETRAKDIVMLCEEDISYLEKQREVTDGQYTSARVIEHHGSMYTLEEADRLTGRIAETRTIYTTRLEEITTERQVLEGERDQLTVELDAIRAEQAEFEAEYQTLVREIERLKRNQEMIELAEKRRGIGPEHHSENMDTLGKIKTAVERARIEQEERLKAARVAPKALDYETRARLLEIQRQRETKQKTEVVPEEPAQDFEEAEEETDFDLSYEYSNN